MACLMIGYQDPTRYAIMDLSADEFETVCRSLREAENEYASWGDDAADARASVQALIAVLERRYEEEAL